MSVTLALSILCENPHRRTGLTTLFHEFVAQALVQFPEVRWVVLAGPDQAWEVIDERVAVVRDFPANDRRAARLVADHWRVAAAARARGAAALLTVGFMPWRTADLPVVMHVFAVNHLRGGGGLGAMYRRWAVGRGMRGAALVIANSRWTAEQLGAGGGKRTGARGEVARAAGRVLVSYEGVDHARFRPEAEANEAAVRARAGLPAEYLLWASNFYGYKRAELVIAAYARLAPEMRVRFPLVMAGGDWAGGRGRAEAAARECGVTRDVRMLGWVDDAVLPALYRGARAQVLATSEETFGRSVAEAMACACPCVVQDLPVLREVTAGAAVLVDFVDAAAAGAALTKVCRDDARWARLRADGVRRAQAFSFEQLARERVAAILDMIGACA